MSDYGYDILHKGYRFKSTESDHKGDSLIEISKDGTVLKSFLFPSYKIWNIPAHADDIIADLESGLRIAGSDGLGGNLYSPSEATDERVE
jgi:hypothetical protein